MPRQRALRLTTSTIPFAWALCSAQVAFAVPTEVLPEKTVESESVPAHTLSPGRTAVWQREYTRARAELIEGRFAVAARLFRQLAETTTDELDRRLALEQAELAAEWANRKVLIAQPDRDHVDTSTSSRRTTDEISILYTNAAVYGLGTGLTLATLTEPNTAAGAILPALGLAGAAVGAVGIVDQSSRSFAYGVPQSIVSGMYIGLEEGLTWVLWNQARANQESQWETSAVSTLIWSSATAGAAIGGVVGTLRGTTPGRASFVGSTALWTGAIAGLTAAAVTKTDDTRDDHGMLAAAIGVSAGALGGMVTAGPVSPSIARVRLLDLGAVGGGLVGAGLYWAAADSAADPRATAASLSLGIGAGLGVAWMATRGMARDLGPSVGRDTSVVQSLRASFAPTQGGALLALHGAL